MVAIPIQLYTAVEDKDLHFNLLHEKCNSRLKQLRWCPKCEEEVEWDEIVKGYEYSKGRYVRVTDEDFEDLPVPTKNTVLLSAFVKNEEIDPIYYEKSYYLEPDAAGVKAFALLWQALVKQKRSAVAKIAIRQKEQLCIVRPRGNALVLDTMYFPDEIRAVVGEIDDVDVSAKELELATQIVEHLSDTFDPEQYQDEYRQALLERIDAKVKGEEIVTAPVAETDTNIIDLMSALKKTLETTMNEKASASSTPKTRKRAAA
jgi:DNA end-binding protein Ku